MRTLFLLISLSLFGCERPKPISNEKPNDIDNQLIAFNNTLIKKRLEAVSIEDYLEIGKNLDTIAKSFSELKYDSIVAINHLHEGIKAVGDTSNSHVMLKCQTLNKTQSEKLIQVLEAKESYDMTRSAKCFAPRMTFVFYRKNDIVAHSAVCLQCSGVSSNIKLVVGNKFVGLSRFGEQSFGMICKELDFSYCK